MKLIQIITHGKKLIGLGDDGIPYEVTKLEKFPKEETKTMSFGVGKSLKDLIHELKLDYVNSGITSANFPDIGEARGQTSLFEIKKVMTTAEVEAAMEKEGLLPANLRELLAYAQNGWDGQTLCVALGSSWVFPDGGRGVPYLDRHGGKRYLNLSWADPEYRWDELYRFVAIRKA